MVSYSLIPMMGLVTYIMISIYKEKRLNKIPFFLSCPDTSQKNVSFIYYVIRYTLFFLEKYLMSADWMK